MSGLARAYACFLLRQIPGLHRFQDRQASRREVLRTLRAHTCNNDADRASIKAGPPYLGAAAPSQPESQSPRRAERPLNGAFRADLPTHRSDQRHDVDQLDRLPGTLRARLPAGRISFRIDGIPSCLLPNLLLAPSGEYLHWQDARLPPSAPPSFSLLSRLHWGLHNPNCPFFYPPPCLF
jgi:hypothetical protein